MDELYVIYDFSYPSPLLLKELASMEVALNLWRREIQQHLTKNGTLRERYPRKKISLLALFNNLQIPPSIAQMINETVSALAVNIPYWLSYHSALGILKSDVLNHFLDFVFDFDGGIHYGKTAKRFMACKGISNDVKFKMACEYCLEDDILGTLSKVARRTKVEEIDFHHQPMLYYWVCRLKNQLYKIVLDDDASSIEEQMLQVVYLNENFWYRRWPPAEYFLNRLPMNIKMKNLLNITNIANLLEETCTYGVRGIFGRYILPKLNEEELKKLVNEKGFEMIIYSEPDHVLRIWTYIKNKMTKAAFYRLVKYALTVQTKNEDPDDCMYSKYCEIWSSAPDPLKQAAIQNVLLVNESSCLDPRYLREHEDFRYCTQFKNVTFLSAMLLDTSIEDRRTFWNDYWETLMCDITSQDFRLLLNLCFNNDENQIAHFKEDLMTKYYKKIHYHLKLVFEDGSFEELEEFLTFCFPNEQTIRGIRLDLLCNHLCDSSYSMVVVEASSLNKFIDKTFEDQDHATEYKNNLMIHDTCIIEWVNFLIDEECDFQAVMDFVNIFAPPEELVAKIRTHLHVPAVKDHIFSVFLDCKNRYSNFDEFENFINWLFKTSDEIIQFKTSLDVDALFQDLIRKKKNYVDDLKRNNVDEDWFENCFQYLQMPESACKKFLKWYFVTPEAVEKFEKKYAHYPMFNRLLL